MMDGWPNSHNNTHLKVDSHPQRDITDPGNPFLDRSLTKSRTQATHREEEAVKHTVDQEDRTLW